MRDPCWLDCLCREGPETKRRLHNLLGVSGLLDQLQVSGMRGG